MLPADLAWTAIETGRWTSFRKDMQGDVKKLGRDWPQFKDLDRQRREDFEAMSWWDGAGAVFDPQNLEIRFKVGSSKQKRLKLASLDLSGAAPAATLDGYADLEGDVSGTFRPWSSAANRRIVCNQPAGGPGKFGGAAAAFIGIRFHALWSAAATANPTSAGRAW
jgi:hypothetical protein